MPRKAVLSAAQQAALIALPSAEHDLRLHYTLSENDLAIIRSKRGPRNRLGFAIQLCYLRFPGQAMTLEAEPPAELLAHVAQQIQVTPDAWTDRLHRIREVKLSANLSQAVHQGRMAQLAREGAQMSAQHLRDLENRRRHATLIAVLLDTEATITDQILDMHDRIVGRMFNEAKRKHEQSFADSGRAINEKVRLSFESVMR